MYLVDSSNCRILHLQCQTSCTGLDDGMHRSVMNWQEKQSHQIDLPKQPDSSSADSNSSPVIVLDRQSTHDKHNKVCSINSVHSIYWLSRLTMYIVYYVPQNVATFLRTQDSIILELGLCRGRIFQT